VESLPPYRYGFPVLQESFIILLTITDECYAAFIKLYSFFGDSVGIIIMETLLYACSVLLCSFACSISLETVISGFFSETFDGNIVE
jgi:hypothetical protein